jgi:hypothetical protein
MIGTVHSDVSVTNPTPQHGSQFYLVASRSNILPDSLHLHSYTPGMPCWASLNALGRLAERQTCFRAARPNPRADCAPKRDNYPSQITGLGHQLRYGLSPQTLQPLWINPSPHTSPSARASSWGRGGPRAKPKSELQHKALIGARVVSGEVSKFVPESQPPVRNRNSPQRRRQASSDRLLESLAQRRGIINIRLPRIPRDDSCGGFPLNIPLSVDSP